MCVLSAGKHTAVGRNIQHNNLYFRSLQFILGVLNEGFFSAPKFLSKHLPVLSSKISIDAQNNGFGERHMKFLQNIIYNLYKKGLWTRIQQPALHEEGSYDRINELNLHFPGRFVCTLTQVSLLHLCFSMQTFF